MTIGIILAGGKSRRFKQDKALFYDPQFHKTWVELATEKLRPLTTELFISVNKTNAEAIHKLLIDQPVHLAIDTLPSVGPLGGLLTVAQQVDATDFLVLAVDYPELTSESLQKLLATPDCYAVDAENNPHFTIAHLNFEAQKLADYLATGNRRLKFFYQQLGLQTLTLPMDQLKNHNYR